MAPTSATPGTLSHTALSTASVLAQSCNCASWGRIACAERHAADSAAFACQQRCCSLYHRCPRGSYLDRAGHNMLRQRLLAWQQQRTSEGWSSKPWLRMADAFERSGTSTYCSANSVKPPQCRRDHWATGGDQVPHYKLPSGRVGFPLRSVHGGIVEFVHQHDQSGRLRGPCPATRGQARLHPKAWGWPPDS